MSGFRRSNSGQPFRSPDDATEAGRRLRHETAYGVVQDAL